MSAQIEGFVTKYAEMLGASGLPRPIIKLRDNLGSKWLGRCTYRLSSPDTTVIEIQKAILAHERTLERVVAHEMIHHVEALTMTPEERRMLQLGVKPQGHGSDFLAHASKINAVMGNNFVTVKSDQEYVIENTKKKEFYLLIAPLFHRNHPRLGWAWSPRPSPDALEWAQKRVQEGGKLIKSTDLRWTAGAKLKRFGGLAVPSNDEEAKLLRELYDKS